MTRDSRTPGVEGTNFGKAASDYGAFRAGFPDSFFERLAAFDVGLPDQTIVDLGTGTGTLARGFALRGCTAIGVDIDRRMIAQAKKLDRESGASVSYVVAPAESTTLDADIADAVVAGQCWHWFDRPRATAETLRLLRSSGKLVIAHFDWLPLSGNVVEATEQLIMAHNPAWRMAGGLGIHPQWLPGLSEAGFEHIESFSYDIDAPYTPAGWRGRIRASAGVAALSDAEASRFDSALRDLLADRFPAKVLAIPHRVFAIVAEAPGD